MRVFIIYTSPIAESTKNANRCLDSFVEFPSWQPELFDGCTPNTIDAFEQQYGIKNTRARITPEHAKYATKKSCFYSHFSMWVRCAELNEPIAIIEHDTYCIGEVPEGIPTGGITQLTTESVLHVAWRKPSRIKQNLRILDSKPPGIHIADFNHYVDVTNYPVLKTSFTPNNYTHGTLAGGTGYIITPVAATRVINEVFEHGWEQNDALLNAYVVPLYYVLPSPIVFDNTREIHSSSAWRP